MVNNRNMDTIELEKDIRATSKQVHRRVMVWMGRKLSKNKLISLEDLEGYLNNLCDPYYAKRIAKEYRYIIQMKNNVYLHNT